MIEVNLLPGSSKKRSGRRRPAFALPNLGGLGGDRWAVGAGLVVVLSLASIGWLHFSVAGEAEELELRIEAAASDSTRLADVIARSDGLRARRDSIAQRVAVIQQIDGNRYVWPHILDEVARALPDFTWLSRIQQVTASTPLVVRVEGRAGTYFALTSLMEALESSPFLRETTLVSSTQAPATSGSDQMVYHFALEVEYREPPPELIETEPLFDGTVAPPSSEEG